MQVPTCVHTGTYTEACIHIHTHPLIIKHTVIHIDHESCFNDHIARNERVANCHQEDTCLVTPLCSGLSEHL